MKIKSLASSSKGNCYIVDDVLMIESGIDTKKIIKGVEKLPEYCLVSHLHADHSKSARELENLGVQILCSKETAEACKLDNPTILENLKTFEFDEFSIMPFELPHDVHNFGYIVQTKSDVLLFMTDFGYIPYRFSSQFTEIMIEANYSEEILEKSNLDERAKHRIRRDHFSLENIVRFLNSLDLTMVKKIRLIHLSDRNSDAELFRKTIEKETGKITEVMQ